MRKDARHEGRRWIQQAQIDLKWSKHLCAEGGYYLVCFLAQQVAEKALKADIFAQGEELVVRRLCQRAGEYEDQFGHHLDEWAILDSHHIPTRYPNGLPDDIPARVYNRAATQTALTLPEEVVAVVGDWFTRTGSPVDGG